MTTAQVDDAPKSRAGTDLLEKASLKPGKDNVALMTQSASIHLKANCVIPVHTV